MPSTAHMQIGVGTQGCCRAGSQEHKLVFIAPQVPVWKLSRVTLRVQGWDLVLTGHSLGAGAAALIALKLRSRFPGARAPQHLP